MEDKNKTNGSSNSEERTYTQSEVEDMIRKRASRDKDLNELEEARKTIKEKTERLTQLEKENSDRNFKEAINNMNLNIKEEEISKLKELSDGDLEKAKSWLELSGNINNGIKEHNIHTKEKEETKEEEHKEITKDHPLVQELLNKR